MTADLDDRSSGKMMLQMLRDSEEYQTELLRLSVEREKLRLEQLKQDIQPQGRSSMFLGAMFGLGIMFGVGIFALLEKLPAIIEAIKH